MTAQMKRLLARVDGKPATLRPVQLIPPARRAGQPHTGRLHAGVAQVRSTCSA